MNSTIHVVPGPREHGVVLHALQLLDQPALASASVRRRIPDPGQFTGPLHLHVTDHLWGPTPGTAADRITALAAGTSIGVTLHDIPDPTDPRTTGGSGERDRVAAYRRIADAAQVVVVASEFEAELLRRAGTRGPITVIGLPRAEPRPAPRDPGDRLPQVAMLGFLHPGKGMETVLETLGRLRLDLAVVNLGPIARGHEEYGRRLHELAAAQGTTLQISGWLSDADLLQAARAVAVPVLAHRHMSASGSVGSWWQAGRRPIAVPNPYLSELEESFPQTLELTDDLAGAIAAAWQDPARTWLPAGTKVGAGPAEVAEQLARTLQEAWS